MPAPAHEALRARIAELKAMDLDRLRHRAALLQARVGLEQLADALAEATDTDADVALLVVHAVWTAKVETDLLDTAAEVPAPDVFAAEAEVAVRAVLEALASGVVDLPDAVHATALRKVIDLGRQGVRITPTQDALQSVAGLIKQAGL